MKHFQITSAQLEDKGACKSDVAKVRALYGDGPIKLTKKNLRIALNNNLDITWLVRYLDNDSAKVYETQRAQAREVCDTQCAQAREAYKAQYAQAWEVCDTQCARSREVYEARCIEIIYNLLNRG